jgi:hypothetical protein
MEMRGNFLLLVALPGIGHDTAWTEPDEFQSVREHVVIGSIPDQFLDIVYRFNVHIRHAATGNTAHMAVICHIPVEAFLSTRQLQLLCQSLTAKNLKVPVHGGHADIRQMQSHEPV